MVDRPPTRRMAEWPDGEAALSQPRMPSLSRDAVILSASPTHVAA